MKEPKREMDSSAFVILADYVPNVIQEIRYHSTLCDGIPDEDL